MKKIIIFNIIIATILILAACAKPQPSVIGILNMNQVLEESKRARQLTGELSRIGDELEETYQQKEQELSGENKDKELDKIYQEFLNSKQTLEGQLNQEIKQVLAEITDEKNVDVVLNNKNVHFGGEDITELLIDKLDQQFYEE